MSEIDVAVIKHPLELLPAWTGDNDRVLAQGGRVVRSIDRAPVDVERSGLYSPDELFDTTPYERTVDGRAHAWAQATDGASDLLAQVRHDVAIDRALTDWVQGRRMVGVMGGHAAQRGSAEYEAAARLGALLGRHLVVATGGGPGAMEAANLGCRFARSPAGTLTEALARVAVVPSFRPSVDAWLEAAREALVLSPDPAPSLGVPTWHYGHEPPNLFATAIAKYFRNALRESILLQVCDAGIVFLPGTSGTVQEIFQDACKNYYAAETAVAPMVLVGRRYWTEHLPAWALLQAVARGRPMEDHIHLVDTVEEASELFAAG
ncbi:MULTISPECIES: LOG family protein [Nocardioides]|uniref:LOG family protein n=1 Tax=Nocardioides vastitatis TaxID=2568655 RepID=A0ABW0ZJE1_9ACTN|nr:LOG family protein [Nocardioides sp.]